MDDKKNKREDITGRMADTLRNHAAPYQEGAWERFESRYSEVLPSARLRKTRWSRWKWGVAAAVLLLVGVVSLWFVEREQTALSVLENPQVQVQQVVEKPPVELESPIAESVNSDPSITQFSAVEPLNLNVEIPDIVRSHKVLEPLPVVGLQQIDLSLETGNLRLPGQPIDRPGSPIDPPIWPPDQTLAAKQDKSPQDGRISGGVVSTGSKKWNMGLILASAMTTEQLNVGGGVSVAYRLSDRMSLRSGLSLGTYGVNTDGTRPGMGRSGSQAYDSPATHPSLDKQADSKPVRYTRQLEATTSNLLAMDIPIDLKYSWTPRFYTAVGVSFLGILEENRTHHFIDRINEPVFTENASAGNDIAYSVHVFQVDERAAEQPLHGKGYAGFLNLSVGHRTLLSDKISLSIEPFFKLPVGRLSNEDMNLTNGGIRIVTGF